MKRLPKKILYSASNRFLRFSLQTDLPLDAVVRAGCLLAVYEQREPEIVNALNKKEITPEQAIALLKEMLRAELNRILKEQNADCGLSDQETNARIEALENENKVLKAAMRKRDWSSTEPALLAAGETISIPVATPVSADLGRRAVAQQRQINEVEIDVLDGEDVRVAASNLLTEDENRDFDRFIEGEIMLSGAIESAVANATSQDMANKYAATGAIALEFWGDIALSTVTTEHVKDLMWFVQRIPALHGKKHGNNRFVKDRPNPTKREEVEIADLNDAAMRAEIEADELLPLPEKRARLAEVLIPRLAMTTVGHHLDRLHAIFRNAQETLGYKGQIRFLTKNKMQQHIKVLNEKNKDPLFFRKEKPKERDSWSQERLKTLLMSPVYTGCSSDSRRWKPGPMIIRDAKYWVPLLVMTLGSRILEVLQLKKTDLIVHDGVLSLRLGITAEHRVKTSDSKRVLPLPQLLIDMGFVEWVHSLPALQRLLFPSPAQGADIAAISGNFGKQLKTLFTHLGIADWHEDFYALRKTMSSALEDAGVPENRRQAIAGHAGGNTINRSYTRRNVSTLKSELDKFDLKVTVGFSESLGHPIIKSCDLLAKPTADVEVELDIDETARVVRIKSTQCGKVLVHAQSFGVHPSKYQIGKETSCTSTELAVRLRKISEDYHLCLPNTPQRRQAIESLMAYAHVV